MPVQVFRIQSQDDAQVLEPLIQRFHDKVQGLRYNLIWSIQNIAFASTQHHNSLVLAAWDEIRGDYLGYLWCALSPNGESFVHQAYSATPEAGRALQEAMSAFCSAHGTQRVDGLLRLRPGEAMQVLSAVRRVNLFSKRTGFVPTSLWMTLSLQREH